MSVAPSQQKRWTQAIFTTRWSAGPSAAFICCCLLGWCHHPRWHLGVTLSWIRWPQSCSPSGSQGSKVNLKKCAVSVEGVEWLCRRGGVVQWAQGVVSGRLVRHLKVIAIPILLTPDMEESRVQVPTAGNQPRSIRHNFLPRIKSFHGLRVYSVKKHSPALFCIKIPLDTKSSFSRRSSTKAFDKKALNTVMSRYWVCDLVFVFLIYYSWILSFMVLVILFS